MDNGLKFQGKPFNLHYFLAAGLLFTGKAHAVDWPEFQGGSAQGHAKPRTKLPLEWFTIKKTSLGNRHYPEKAGPPTILKGRLYLTAAVAKDEGLKADRELRALCLEASSGRVVWDKSVFSQDGASAPRIHKKNSHASPTPVITPDGKLYVHFGHQGTACLNLEGMYSLAQSRYQLSASSW